MKPAVRLILSTSPPAQPGGKPPGLPALRCRQRLPCQSLRYRPVVKELDAETGLYYYGARYLDPKTSRWLSGDPAMGEYIPSAPVNDEARKRNGNLPGMGGVFNHVNLHAYHYAGNNPVAYRDPDGKFVQNNTNSALVIRTEDGDYELVGPGGTYFGKVDGVVMQNGTIHKISDTNKFDFSIPGVNIKVKTSEINLIVGQDEDGNYTFNLLDFHSVVINWLGDILKEKDKSSSGTYDIENRPEELKGWWTGANNTFSDHSTWNEAAFNKRIENHRTIMEEGNIPEDWMQY